MTDDAQPYDIGTMYKLLLAAFTPGEMRRFLRVRPLFRPVLDRFGPGHGLDAMVDGVIEYCETHLLWDELLAEVKEVNPRQYARFEPDLYVLAPHLAFEPELVEVPAGAFLMGGTDEYSFALLFSMPQHQVTLPAFEIGRYPVTNAEYAAFVEATFRQPPHYWPDGHLPEDLADHPVHAVSWYDAQVYTAWLRAQTGRDYRLPTEAEWEKAARGEDGRLWPWGNEWDLKRCNSADGAAGTTTPVGQYSPVGDSPYGCADMAGNVREWTQSLLKPYPYQTGDGREDLETDDPRVLRGGAFNDNQWFVCCAFRLGGYPIGISGYRGFRVVVAPGFPAP